MKCLIQCLAHSRLSLIHLFNRYSLRAYHVPGTRLGAWMHLGSQKYQPLLGGSSRRLLLVKGPQTSYDRPGIEVGIGCLFGGKIALFYRLSKEGR